MVPSSNKVIEGIEPFPARNMNETIQERVIQYINNQKLNPGAKLPSEGQLAEALGVSRISLRESMRALEALGIISAKAGSGWYVNDFSFDSIAKALAYSLDLNEYSFSDIQEVRICLEIYFLPDAIRNLQSDDLEDLERLVELMEARGGEGLSFYEQDYDFHQILFSRIPNLILSKVLDLFWALFQYLPNSVLPPEEYTIEAHRHRLIFEAIKTKDIVLARQRMIEHFEHTDSTTLSNLN